MITANEQELLNILFRLPYRRNRFYLIDYPFTNQLVTKWRNFLQQFPNEHACYSHLYNIKWPNGFRCPQCDHTTCTSIYTRTSPIYQCHRCTHQTTLIAHTIMTQSRTSLSKWLMAFFFLSLDQIGVNAYQLHLLLKVTYKTAWSMHRKIREAISTADAKQLLGNTAATASANIYGFMFERAPQQKPTMIGFELQPSQPLSNKHHAPYVFTCHSTNNYYTGPVKPRVNSYSEHQATLANLMNSFDPTTTHIKLRLIPEYHFSQNATVSHHYVHHFKEQQFNHHKVAKTVIPAPQLLFRQKRAVQKAFDYMMRRLIRTYGALKNNYLQHYFNEMSFYYEATVHQRSIFDHLSTLCMFTRTQVY